MMVSAGFLCTNATLRIAAGNNAKNKISMTTTTLPSTLGKKSHSSISYYNNNNVISFGRESRSKAGLRRKSTAYVEQDQAAGKGMPGANNAGSKASAAGSTSASNPFTKAFQWYAEKLDTQPVLTKAITAGVIGAMGDFLCQAFVDKPEKEEAKRKNNSSNSSSNHAEDDSFLWWFEPGRTARFLMVGTVVVGPGCHVWFGTLARWYPQLTASSILKRVALDQFAFTPCILSVFLSSLWQLENFMEPEDENSKTKGKSSIPMRLQESLPSIVVANWMVWFPVQLINFRLVPQKFQVLFANFISLFWNGYLSFSSRGTTAPTPAPAIIHEEIRNAPPVAEVVRRMTTKGGTKRFEQGSEEVKVA